MKMSRKVFGWKIFLLEIAQHSFILSLLFPSFHNHPWKNFFSLLFCFAHFPACRNIKVISAATMEISPHKTKEFKVSSLAFSSFWKELEKHNEKQFLSRLLSGFIWMGKCFEFMLKIEKEKLSCKSEERINRWWVNSSWRRGSNWILFRHKRTSHSLVSFNLKFSSCET